jgi:hypothetical protein
LKKNILVEDAILLIEQNFYFLTIGEYFNDLSKKYNLSLPEDEIVTKNFKDDLEYSFNSSIINEILSQCFIEDKTRTSLFEYFIEMNSIRGICMAMIEALRIESDFQEFISLKLKDQYNDFIDIVSFVRNVLSHNIHADMCLTNYDFKGTLERIIRKKRDPNIDFKFNYHDLLKEINSPSLEYGLYLKINFSKLKKGIPFFKVISQLELILLGELCFNLSISYRIFKNN